MLHRRMVIVPKRLNNLLVCMRATRISSDEKVFQLRESLSEHYEDKRFLNCMNMGSILTHSISLVEEELRLVESERTLAPFLEELKEL